MRRIPTLLVAGVVLAAGTAHGKDLNAGAEKAKQVCAACHGMDGNSQIPDYPKLGGQHPDYLAKALRDYASGARKNPIMGAMAKPLTRQDIENVAAYYASQPPLLSSRE
jgi:cytochrome c553